MIYELIMGGVWLLFSAAMLISTFGYRDVGSLAAIGPAYWPRILLAGMIVLSAVLIVRAVRGIKTARGADSAEQERAHPHLFWSTIGLTFLYILALPYLGFPLTTVVYLLVMLRSVGVRGTFRLPALALGLSLMLIFIFANFMSVPLPRGEGFCHQISLWLF